MRAVVGSSGGAPYALVCAARMPKRVRLVGVIGGVAPADPVEVRAARCG